MISNNITVIKLGGSFLASHEALHDVASLARMNSRAVFVVSAFKGITDRLVLAFGKDLAAREAMLRDILAYHANLIQSALPGIAGNLWLPEILYELGPEYYGMSRFNEFARKADYDAFVSIGEKMSAAVISIYLANAGIRCRSVTSDHLGISVIEVSGNPIIEIEKSHLRAYPLVKKLLDSGCIPITTGFFGINEAGRIKTLGRNSSDYSAVAIGAVLRSGEVQLFKDVPGIYSHDPKLIQSGEQHFARISYHKALELSRAGSKVIHPMAIITARQHGISLRIRKYGDSSGGTLVTASPDFTAAPS